MHEIIEITNIMKRTNRESRILGQNNYRNVSNAIFVLNGNYEIVFSSPNLKSNLGYEAGDILGKSFFQFLHAGDRESVKAAFGNSIKIISKIIGSDEREPIIGGVSEFISNAHVDAFLENYSTKLRRLSAITPVMYRFKRKDGKWCWLESSCMLPFVKANGNIMITISSHDVTESVKLQKLLKKKLEKAEQKIQV